MTKPARHLRRQSAVVTQPSPAVAHVLRPQTRSLAPAAPPLPDPSKIFTEDDREDDDFGPDGPDDDEDEDEDEEKDDQDDWDDRGDDVAPPAPGDGEVTADRYLHGKRLQLPSGGWIHIRPISLLTLIQSKQVPNTLLPAARRMVGLDERMQVDQQGQPRGRNVTLTDDTIAIMNFLVCQLVSSFTVVEKPQSECRRGEVSCGSILECDKNAIVNFAMQGQAALRSFRNK